MRRPWELACRLVGLGALLAALLLAWRVPARVDGAVPHTLTARALQDSTAHAAVAELTALMASAASDSTWPRVHLLATALPEAVVRAALGTAAAAGMRVQWTERTGAMGLVVSASADADPQGGVVVRARSVSPRPLVVRDAASVLDSMPDGRAGLTVRGARLSGLVSARQGTSTARVAVPAPIVPRRVLVYAHPGWETKFVTAALEERGWQVDARVLIARRAFVTTGAPGAADTARYAAVVVLDSGVVGAETLTRFVRQGGGIVLAGDALRDPSLGGLRPATVVADRPAVAGALLTDAPRQGLDAFELRPAARAVVLQREPHGPHADATVVAWRLGAGRLLASAYRETWHWRMEGREDALEAHRAWWSGLVSAAAFVPAPSDSARAAGGESTERFPGSVAPWSDMVARVGAPSVMPAVVRDAPRGGARLWLLYLLASVALLAEWTLRRMRGAR